MRYLRSGPRAQAGDTLVEVVMSLAILAVTLVTAFNVANLSYSEGVQAREHTQAIYLAQAQAEKLYLYRDDLIAADPSDTSSIMDAAHFSVCNGGCHFIPSGITPIGGPYQPTPFNGIQYYVSIGALSGNVTNASQNEGAFTVTVTWDSAISTGVAANGGSNENSTTLNLVLVDKRGIIPRDCSVVGGSACS